MEGYPVSFCFAADDIDFRRGILRGLRTRGDTSESDRLSRFVFVRNNASAACGDERRNIVDVGRS